MGVVMEGKLLSAVACETKHGPSGSLLRTMAPQDNGGDGSSYSPTDLLAASLVTCKVTTMGLYARAKGIPWDEVTYKVEKIMSTTPPRRIAQLIVEIHIKMPGTEEEFQRLVEEAKKCPVRNSLSEDVQVVDSYHRI